MPEDAYSPEGTATDAYSPFIDSAAAAVMNSAIAEAIYDAQVTRESDAELVPITSWECLAAAPPHGLGKRLPGGTRKIELDVALTDDSVAPLSTLRSPHSTTRSARTPPTLQQHTLRP